MAVLSVQVLPVAGVSPTFTAAASGGDEVPVGPGHFVVVKNASAGAVTVTFRVPVADGAVTQTAPSVAAGAERWFPVPVRDYSRHAAATIIPDANANATLAYSAVTSVTVAAVKAP